MRLTRDEPTEIRGPAELAIMGEAGPAQPAGQEARDGV